MGENEKGLLKEKNGEGIILGFKMIKKIAEHCVVAEKQKIFFKLCVCKFFGDLLAIP
jgi:hypothetical protein